MPLNDYYCPKCKQRLSDVLLKEGIPKCPTCKKDMVKMLSIPNIVFKGKGWESNDYKDKK